MEDNNLIPLDEDKFAIAFRILGNEVFAMELMSKSHKKNWVVFGFIALILATIFLNQLMPVIVLISELTANVN